MVIEMRNLKSYLTALCIAFSPSVFAETAVPHLSHIGSIPVQWQGSVPRTSNLNKVMSQINSEFNEIVKSSNKFYFVNDDLVRSNWAEASGRRMLAEQFELDSFIALNITIQDDIWILDGRLMAATLEPYLFESERIPVSWLYAATEKDVRDRVRSLVYRLLNRYPLDAFVTSIQGHFVTLSAGLKQGLYEGQEIKVQSCKISSTHPVNGTWIGFEYKYLGKVKIVDTKQNSAIGEITHLINKDSIRVGDGIQIESIAPRKLFAELSRQDKAESIDIVADNPIVFPVSEDKKSVKVPATAVQDKKKTAPQTSSQIKKGVIDPDQINLEPEQSSPESNEPSVVSLIAARIEKAFDLNLRRLTVRPGLNLWSFSSGSSSAAASIPLWIINNVSIDSHLVWDEKSYTKVTGTLHSGPTENGSALGIDFGMSYIMKHSNPGFIDPSVDGIEYGAKIALGSLSISDESFGGRDVIEVGGLLGLYGRYHVRELGKTLHYRGGLRYDLLALGRSGLDDGYASVNGKRFADFYAEADVLPAQGDWLWGGFINLGLGSYQSDKGSIDSSHFAIGVRASRDM